MKLSMSKQEGKEIGMRYTELFEDFCRKHPWTLIEDDNKVKLTQRWLKGECIYLTNGVHGDSAYSKNGGYEVRSQDDIDKAYLVRPEMLDDDPSCTCVDSKKAPHSWCKHKLGSWIYREIGANRRVTQMTNDNNSNFPEARASWTVKFKYQGFDQ